MSSRPDSPFKRTANAAHILSDNITIYYLQRIRGGVRPILDRIPSGANAVYAWFRDESFPDPTASTSDDYLNIILRTLRDPHCSPRRANLPPQFRVDLSSYRELSDTKVQSLKALCEFPAFRTAIAEVAELGILFQSPLYIGKTIDLRCRIDEHLRADSDLRSRLHETGVNIETCALLTIIVPKIAELEDELESANVLEDVLSRIYLPTFTLRYG